MQKAFNKVWHTALIFKFIVPRLLDELIKIYLGYFKSRSSIVRVGNFYSNPKPINSSVFQGFFTEAHLFNTYVNDFPKEPNTDLVIFADETAMFHKHVNTALSKIRKLSE